MLERDIEKHLVQEVAKLRGKAYKWSSPSNRAVPDRICALPFGITKLVECKATGKKPTPLQAKIHKVLRKMGHEVLVVDSKPKVDILIQVWKEEINEIRRNL